MVTTKMNWSGPNVIHFGRKLQFGPNQFILLLTISFWSIRNHYGQVQINLVRPKPFWTDQNCFGHIEGQGMRLILQESRSKVGHFLKTTDKLVILGGTLTQPSSELGFADYVYFDHLKLGS